MSDGAPCRMRASLRPTRLLRVAPSPCVLRFQKSTSTTAAQRAWTGPLSVSIRRERRTVGLRSYRCCKRLAGVARGEVRTMRAPCRIQRGRAGRAGPGRDGDGRIERRRRADAPCGAPSSSISPSAHGMSIKADERHITSRVFTKTALRALSQDGYVKVFVQTRTRSAGARRLARSTKLPGKNGHFARAVGAVGNHARVVIVSDSFPHDANAFSSRASDWVACECRSRSQARVRNGEKLSNAENRRARRRGRGGARRPPGDGIAAGGEGRGNGL